MSTVNIRITSPFFAPNTDLRKPSAIDVYITGSTDPFLPNGQYDAWCLNPAAPIAIGTTYTSESYGSRDLAAYPAIDLASISAAQIAQLNWLVAQNFTWDPKFGGQYNFGEVQAAIWEIIGYTNYNTIPGVTAYLTNNGAQVVSTTDIAQLKSLSAAAIASGQAVLPPNAFFAVILDPAGSIQPILAQLHSSKLGDYVWEDLDGDGLQDANEAGVNGVTVRLLDGAGNVLATTTTGDDLSTVAVEQGFYQFTGLAAGQYRVEIVRPADFLAFTQANANANSQDTIDSDVDTFGRTQVVTLGVEEINGTLDAGLVRRAEIGNRVWLDSNGNGIQDGTEVGVANVTVFLKNAAGTVVGTTTTNTAGEYLFTNLTPGTYSVQFVAPTGFIFTGRDAAGSTDANDSDADLTTGDTIQTFLTSGESDLTWDAGLTQRARIGDTIFLDKDADGIQDAGEGGISGVTVNLCDAAGNIIGTTTTDANGKYFFDVAPGTYGIRVVAPAGFVITAANQGADDALDSDIDAAGKSSNVTVASGGSGSTPTATASRTAPKSASPTSPSS